MDPRRNPYAPGAGSAPPELAGRDEVLERTSIMLDRLVARHPTRGFIFYGLRGVGKTVLLQRVLLDAEVSGMAVVEIEAPEDQSLPAMLAPALRATLIRMSKGKMAKAMVRRALGVLAAFVRAAKIKYEDVEISMDFIGEEGMADSGDLELDLGDLLIAVGEAAAEHHTAAVLFIDELQYVKEKQLAALTRALHKTSQRRLPITLVAAGLPQLLAQMGRAKSYTERLFEFVEIGPLDEADGMRALRVPAAKEQVEFSDDALRTILSQTQGYPYFIQEWGKQAWNTARQSPISRRDALTAGTIALADLDASFFRVRFDRLAPAEKRYARAMATLGQGPYRTGDIARVLEEKTTTVGPIRARLIKKGMVYSPSHGDTAFTVPLFADFLERTMPWRPAPDGGAD
ncbi:ATP-binding protein [Acidithiobacillus ferrianus]|uniref:AAA family ATPase n=2 Tax=Acidithiobacillus ferrianus TaxID=2678518 RepID=A0A845UQ12_9PROT|nr:ATP-binding protein [Acidithiobacillus ferrianus]NDU43618.1 AAA family ATPase [Acidithiobacillus ferrianus]